MILHYREIIQIVHIPAIFIIRITKTLENDDRYDYIIYIYIYIYIYDEL